MKYLNSIIRGGLIPLLYIALLLAPGSGWAQDPATETPPAQPATFPGLSEVQPNKADLLRAAADVQSSLLSTTTLAEHEQAVVHLRAQQEALQKQIEELGAPEKWSSDRLLDIRQSLENQRIDQQKRLEMISSQAILREQELHDWEQRQLFWKEWESHLAPLGKMTRGSFRESQQAITATLAALNERHTQLVTLQQQTAVLLDAGLLSDKRLAEIFEALRRDLLRKSAPALYSPRFFTRFNDNLRLEIQQDLQAAAWTRPGFFDAHTLLFAAQLFILVTVFLIIRRYRHAEIAEEWQFLTARPLAAAFFAAFAGPGLFYVQPPSLISLVLRVLTLGSAALLLHGLLKNRRLRQAFYLLIGVEFGKELLDALFMPLPIQRLYHFATCLFITLLIYRSACRDRQAVATRHYHTALLYLIAGLFLAATIAQATGFSTLGFTISALTVNTLFTSILLLMAIYLGRGAIDFLVDLAPLQKWRFISRHGAGLAKRLKLLLQLCLLFEGGLYLLNIWRVFPTRAQAIETISSIGVSISGTEVNLGMLLWAAIVMILTYQISWLIRSLVDTTLLRSRRTDRGVRDAARKLIHYSFLAIGVLLALTTAGVDARVFAVVGGAFGIGIGFGLQNIVNNFVSGIILLFERPIKAGDTIIIDSEWGTVKSIGLRSTVVETIDNSEIIVPNSQLISEKVTNWTLSTTMARVVMPVGVAYGTDIAKVLEILTQTGKEHPQVLVEPAVSAIFSGFGASSLDFELRVFIANIQDRLRVRSEILQGIAAGLNAAGIEIPFPQHDLHLRSIDVGAADRLQPATQVDKETAP